MPLVTPHFYTASDNSGWGNAPDSARANLADLADLLERFRATGDHVPMTVTSGYRSTAHNATVGGGETSQHLTGSAADVAVAAPLHAWASRTLARIPGHMFGQVILYPYSTGHVHISLPNRASGITGEVLVETGPKRYAQWTPGTPWPRPLAPATATGGDQEGTADPLFLLLLALALVIAASLFGV